jgi:TBC1 domain family member 20
VFLLTLGENLGFYCADAASRFRIWDYMLENFEPGVIPALKLVMKILLQVDEECYEILTNCGDIPTFTLSWLLTWYSHVLPDFSHVQRIFDACLS